MEGCVLVLHLDFLFIVQIARMVRMISLCQELHIMEDKQIQFTCGIQDPVMLHVLEYCRVVAGDKSINLSPKPFNP